MRRGITLSIAFLAPALSTAQIPGPPEELSRFDVLLGRWEGSGVARESADGPAAKWTGRSTVTRILDGYFIQEDTRIDMGEGAPTPLIFRTIYGWDRHAERILYLSMNNMGPAEDGTAHWSADGKLITGSFSNRGGTPATEQGVSTIAGDTYTFRLDRSTAGGPFFTMVEGTFRRGGKPFTADAGAPPGPALMPPPEAMARLKGHLGTWRSRGQVSPLPGGDPIAISGSETRRPILGGHVHLGQIQGDEVPGAPRRFRGEFYLTWDPARNSFLAFAADNYGFWSLEEGHLQGDNKLVYTGAAVVFGMPQTTRSVVEWSEDSARAVTDRCAGTHPPDEAFALELTRVPRSEL